MDRHSPLSAWCPAGLSAGLTILLVLSVSAAPPPTDGWKFDVVHLKNGKPFRGLLVEETPAIIRLQCVQRKPGQPTFVVFSTFQRDEVARIERLSPAEREILATRLRSLDPTGKGEERRMDEIELTPAPWGDTPAKALSYTSDHFVLISNAPEEVVRRAAVRLEDIYSAFTRYLPPRQIARPAAPTTIVLAGSLAEYQQLVRSQGQLLNPAVYDQATNRILCASDLEQLGDDLKENRLTHQRYLSDITKQESEIRKLPRGDVRDRLLKEAQEARQRIKAVVQYNERVFDRATRRLFHTLYHEAFHAYLASFVYPPDECGVPRWLNEGLAQIFETAIVEAGELRVGHADPVRLAQVRILAKRGELVPVSELLRAGPKQFLVGHASDQQISNRFYTTSWALAFYLTFELRKLGTPELDQYVRALKRDTDPHDAFRQLCGLPLPRFEHNFQLYVLGLQSDGTARR